MHTKLTFSHISIIGIIYLLALDILLIPSAFSNEENTVSLEMVIQIAMRENPRLNAIREKLKVSRARTEGIALLDNPNLETKFTGGINGDQTLELSQSFQLGGQRGHRKRIANIHLDKINAEFAEASRVLTKLVKMAFYELALVQEKLKLTKEVIQHNEQMHDIAQFQFEAGDISVTQSNLATIQLQSAQREAATLEGELQLAQLELNHLMGTALETTPIAIKGLPEKTPPKASLKMSLDDLKTHALTHRNDLKSLQLDARLTDNELRLAKAENIPNLNIGALAERSEEENALGVKFSIPLPFFDRNRPELNAAKAQQQVDAIEVSNQERQINQEVMASHLSVRTALKTLSFYEEDSVKLLNENLKLTRTAYELGEANLLEVILMQNEFVEMRFAYLDALATYYKALTQLEAAVGIPIELLP